MSTGRRFPPPRTAEEMVACYVVRDSGGQALAYVYYENERGFGSSRLGFSAFAASSSHCCACFRSAILVSLSVAFWAACRQAYAFSASCLDVFIPAPTGVHAIEAKPPVP